MTAALLAAPALRAAPAAPGGPDAAAEVPDEEASPPAAPSNVRAVPGDAQLSLSWDPVPGASSYNIYRSPSPQVGRGAGTLIENARSPRLVSRLSNGTTYYLVVTAVNEAGEGPASAAAWAFPHTIPPAAPAGVAAASVDSQVIVRWSPVPGAISYNLYYARAPGVTRFNGRRVPGVKSPKALKRLESGRTYYFTVTAVNAAGEGPESGEVSAQPAGEGEAGAAAAAAAPAALRAVRVYPNPWRGDRHARIPVTFDRLPPEAVVRVLTMSGREVAVLPAASSSVSWDLTDEAGGKVASGEYIYQVDAREGGRKAGVLAVIR